MEFKRLRLSGFKSFVEPAELRIEPGLTGVVGPNGCGKSNLLEAIRWVMGENSPKSLRSGGMEDVIFAGTEARSPRDFAEVQLSIADDEGDDLEVVRRVERGAGSAYRINGKDVRAKDVALTFADAATGAHSPALVSQGKIAQVIAAKPTERRQMLEEAAGISGLHVRRKDAEQKLRATEANLARLEDIMAGLDSQIATLRRQAKAAERYTKVSDQIRVAEARLVFSRWRDAAAAANAARKEAEAAEAKVTEAQARAREAEKAQAAAAERLAEAREEQADRRDDATAHGHRMAALSDQLQAAEERLADLDRQKARLESDRGDADRLTKDAAEALSRLERELRDGADALAADERRLPTLRIDLEKAESAARAAELALAKATADQAGVEAEWRVAEAELSQAQNRLDRLAGEARRLADARAALAEEGDPQALLSKAMAAREAAEAALSQAREALEAKRAAKEDLQTARDEASSTLSSAKAELAGIEREWQALKRDREARERQAQGALPKALDKVRAEKGYERALAAVLGRDAKAMLGDAEGRDGRYWTGANKPAPVADSIAAHVTDCPAELAARLALVHVADGDDGRALAPGEWLVTLDGALRRWDGFVARGEGSAEAARLEAENRFADLDMQVPKLRGAVDEAEARQKQTQDDLRALQAELVAAERTVDEAVEAERAALREIDRAEALEARLAARANELTRAEGELSEQREAAEQDLDSAREKKADLPDPATGRATLSAAQAKQDAARATQQAALTALSSHEQSLAVARERAERQKADIAGWQARSDDATKRLSDMSRRFDEIAEERAVIAAKPEGLIKEIEQGDVLRARLTEALASAETAVAEAGETARAADEALREVQEALSTAREHRAAASTRAENEDARRKEMAGVAGERFQAPPPMLPGKFEFDEDTVGPAPEESAEMDRLVANRDRLGPVNLVARSELEEAEERHGASIAEQEELGEAVNRLRGSIGNLNREGRERLRAAFHVVDQHFQRLFARLFEGGEAHLALIDSDDPLEAGLEIFAQPPGKRLQSLTLLSGGEQALTAIALIFGLFLTNPAPICVLDEVDAPLDDANIDRFCDLLDAMTRETATRYLIVTHNAVTMSRMHRLFGVTMIEKGVSRLVSVDLGAAEELLAAE